MTNLRGWTLGKLAQRYGTTVKALAKANSITNLGLIFAGKSLKIPDGFDGPKRRSGTVATAERRSAAPKAHTHTHAPRVGSKVTTGTSPNPPAGAALTR